MLKSSLSAFALSLALGAALPAFAQEAAPADSATTNGLSMGVQTGDQTAAGSNYAKANFEAWEQRCVRLTAGTESPEDPCQLYMLLKDGEGNSVAELSIFNLPEGAPNGAAAGATFIAPLETLLTEGLRLTVDGGAARAYPFSVCTQIGCVARIGFTAEEIAQFKKGANLNLAISPFVAPDQKVELTASLKGFTAGYDAVAAQNKLADEAAAKAAPAAPAAPANP